ncbi:efflux transporter outer membrane subunit [Salegentibacter sp. F188]|uniref:Efflux transporter outer membrane subunit n=1 Tax=Autumnicola patrickiae TaxID=3075591 RepID=A0ABU3E5S4_9FLAO|nr:efflux transporter outer membrane subunit [Salegentibacter sp. F188]MDT0691290.1 efflux transporter outer membrane subunit [Salegentibacter sp. F188]
MKNLKIYKVFLVPVILLSLQGCFVAKDYERPEVVTEANFRTDSLVQDSTTIATVSWREIFTDPVLTQYIEEGLENNIDIRIAVQQIITAEAYVKQGNLGFFPTLNTNAQATHQELSANSQFGSFFSSIDQYEVSGSLSWEADIWGKIRSTKRAFQARYLRSTAAHQAVKTRLISDIASTYYQLLALDEQIRITEQTIENRERSLETTNALKEAGNVTEVGVKQTEAQLYTAQSILVDLKNQERLLENFLSILLGETPMQIERTALAQQEITTDLNIGVPIQLLRNRPDVIAAEYNLLNAFEMSNVARSEFYPSLTLTAAGGFQSLVFQELLDPNSLFATIIGGIAQPIFNGRRIRTAYEVSLAEQEQARLNFRQSILTASREVSDALYSYQAATEKIEIKQKEFDAYDTATEYSEELLNNGFANYLEVLTARENALNSRLDLINARYSQLEAMVDLYQSLGGGWQ